MNLKAFLVGLSILACCSGCSTEAPSIAAPSSVVEKKIVAGRNVMLTTRSRNLPIVEPHISSHPSNNDHLLSAAMAVTDPNRPYESCRLLSFASTDGGQTWTETEHEYWGYDPWTSILPDGYTVLSWIGTKGSFRDEYPIVFLTSADAGLTWAKEAAQTLPGDHDGTKLTAFSNTIYFTTIFFKGHMDPHLRIYSSNDRKPFELKASIDGKGQHLNFAEAAILSDGTIAVPLSAYEKFAWVQTSIDQGKTFSAPYKISEKIGGGKGYFHLIADTSDSLFKNRLYFVRAAGYGEKFDGIFLNYSTDKGKTWSADKRVDLFEGGRSRAITPTAIVNRHGLLGVSWVDSQNEPGSGKNDLYFTISSDGGETFQKPVKISEVSSDPKTDRNSDVANKFPGGGHYLGLAARADGSFQAIWSDSRSGLFQLQTSNITIQD